MSERARIGWVVDAQNDFMRPDGRLYVKDLEDDTDAGAVKIQGKLKEAVAWMSRNCEVVVFTGDWHGYDDEEIDTENPDPAEGTYPPHCMGRSNDPAEREGAQIIEEIRPENPLVLEVSSTPEWAAEVARGAVSASRPVFIQKNRFDVFAGNRATEAFLDGLSRVLDRPLEFYVAGVARDVCVTQAVDGMQKRGLTVTALRDATWGLGLEDEEVTLARWAEGGRVIGLADLPGH
jgi:nicotinamidase-related amidase